MSASCERCGITRANPLALHNHMGHTVCHRCHVGLHSAAESSPFHPDYNMSNPFDSPEYSESRADLIEDISEAAFSIICA